MYLSEKIKIQPDEYKKNRHETFNSSTRTNCYCHTLLPTFSKNGLKLENYQYISMDNNIINFKQLITLPWKLQLDLVNSSMNATFLIRKKQELAFIVPLGKGLQQLKVKYTKTWRYFLTKNYLQQETFVYESKLTLLMALEVLFLSSDFIFSTWNVLLALTKICLCFKKATDVLFDLFKINECNHLTFFAFKRIKYLLRLLLNAISHIVIIIQNYWKRAIKITVLIFTSFVIKKSVLHSCQFISWKRKNQNRL